MARADAAVTRDIAGKRPPLALLATARAEAARAAGAPSLELWRHAAAAWTDLAEPWRQAYCQWREAEACLAERRPRHEASHAAAVAADIARDVGAATLIADIDALARRARLRLHSRPVSAVPDHPFRLTRREVLELVAEGRTDRQIAERLFISHRTVQRHVSNILAKVGAATRAEVTAVAHRAGLVAP